MDSDEDSRTLLRAGCPIRKSPDQRLRATPRGLSQLAASFIACWHQGIHRIALSSLITKVNLSSLPSPCGSNKVVKKTQRIVVIYALFLYLCVVVKEQAAAPSQSRCCANRAAAMVGLTGLEPVTMRLSSACSNQLSYRPIQADG